jgi:hypothetical protein
VAVSWIAVPGPEIDIGPFTVRLEDGSAVGADGLLADRLPRPQPDDNHTPDTVTMQPMATPRSWCNFIASSSVSHVLDVREHNHLVSHRFEQSHVVLMAGISSQVRR